MIASRPFNKLTPIVLCMIGVAFSIALYFSGIGPHAQGRLDGTGVEKTLLLWIASGGQRQAPGRINPVFLDVLREEWPDIAKASGSMSVLAQVDTGSGAQESGVELVERDYCETLAPKLMAGRCFTARELDDDAPPVAIVSSRALSAGMPATLKVNELTIPVVGVFNEDFAGIPLESMPKTRVWLSTSQFSKLVKDVSLPRAPGVFAVIRVNHQQVIGSVKQRFARLSMLERRVAQIKTSDQALVFPAHLAMGLGASERKALSDKTLLLSAVLMLLSATMFAGLQALAATLSRADFRVERTLGISARALLLRESKIQAMNFVLIAGGAAALIQIMHSRRWLDVSLAELWPALTGAALISALLAFCARGFIYYTDVQTLTAKRNGDLPLLLKLSSAQFALVFSIAIFANYAVFDLWKLRERFSAMSQPAVAHSLRFNAATAFPIVMSTKSARLADRLADIPNLGVADWLPLKPMHHSAAIVLQLAQQELSAKRVACNEVFLSHIGARILRGRFPSNANGINEVALSRATALRLYGSIDAALSQNLRWRTAREHQATIVGVVSDVGFELNAETPLIYLPSKSVVQAELTLTASRTLDKTTQASILRDVRLEYPGLEFGAVQSLQAIQDRVFSIERRLVNGALLAALLMLLLMALQVNRVLHALYQARIAEFGTLLAIGAPPMRALWQISQRAIRPLLSWLVLGVPLGLWLVIVAGQMTLTATAAIAAIATAIAGMLSTFALATLLFTRSLARIAIASHLKSG